MLDNFYFFLKNIVGSGVKHNNRYPRIKKTQVILNHVHHVIAFLSLQVVYSVSAEKTINDGFSHSENV
jgi:hypothetical protein